MYARLITFQVLPGKLNKLLHLYKETLRPILEQHAGFKDIFLLNNSTINKVISVTLWRTQADMEAFDVHCQSLSAKFIPFLQMVPEVEIFEVNLPEAVSSIQDVPFSELSLGVRIEEVSFDTNPLEF